MQPDCHHLHPRQFYVVSPLPLSTMKKVNVLIKGSLPLPSQLGVQGGAFSDVYFASGCLTGGGSNPMKTRTNLHRRN